MVYYQHFGYLNITQKLKKNKITVFTITYNCEQYIYRCYTTIIKQSYTNWIWLIVDDGSSDNTENVIRNLNDVRIQYFKLEKNSGRGKARNFGLTKVQTDWLAILDMDDLMLNSRLDKFNNAINCGFDGLISSTLLVDNNLKITGIRMAIYNNYFNLFTHASLCIKTNILSEITYSESRYAEDQRVIVLISNICNLEISNEPLYIYQEDASINVRGAYLSSYFAVINLISTISFHPINKKQLKYLLYILKFVISTIILFLLTKLSIGNKVYKNLIKKRVKDFYQDHSIELELKLYE